MELYFPNFAGYSFKGIASLVISPSYLWSQPLQDLSDAFFMHVYQNIWRCFVPIHVNKIIGV